MAIQATLEGNLTRNPEGKCIVIDGVPRDLVEMRVFSDVNRRNADGGWVQDDERSGAVDVTIWAEKLGAEVLRLFRKGKGWIGSSGAYPQFHPHATCQRGMRPGLQIRCVLETNRKLAMTLSVLPRVDAREFRIAPRCLAYRRKTWRAGAPVWTRGRRSVSN